MKIIQCSGVAWIYGHLTGGGVCLAWVYVHSSLCKIFLGVMVLHGSLFIWRGHLPRVCVVSPRCETY